MVRDNANPESHEVLIWIIVWPLGSQTVFVWSYHFPSLFLSHSWLSFCCCILSCSLSLLGFCPLFPHPVCTGTVSVKIMHGGHGNNDGLRMQPAETLRGLLVSWWIPMKSQHQISRDTLMWHKNTQRSQLEFSQIPVVYLISSLHSLQWLLLLFPLLSAIF